MEGAPRGGRVADCHQVGQNLGGGFDEKRDVNYEWTRTWEVFMGMVIVISIIIIGLFPSGPESS